jgi:hypothetical protein
MRKTVTWFGHGLMPGGFLSLAALFVSGSLAYGAAAPAPTQAMDDLVKNNCLECHNTTDWTGGLALDTLELNDAGQEPEVWEKAINKLRGRLMPPAGKKQPRRRMWMRWLDTWKAPSIARKRKPGRLVMCRYSA